MRFYTNLHQYQGRQLIWLQSPKVAPAKIQGKKQGYGLGHNPWKNKRENGPDEPI